jgi:protein SDA1
MAAFDFAQLQNKIKRDPESYKDEFLLQKRHFETQLQIYQIKPQTDSTDFELQINFLRHV